MSGMNQLFSGVQRVLNKTTQGAKDFVDDTTQKVLKTGSDALTTAQEVTIKAAHAPVTIAHTVSGGAEKFGNQVSKGAEKLGSTIEDAARGFGDVVTGMGTATAEVIFNATEVPSAGAAIARKTSHNISVLTRTATEPLINLIIGKTDTTDLEEKLIAMQLALTNEVVADVIVQQKTDWFFNEPFTTKDGKTISYAQYSDYLHQAMGLLLQDNAYKDDPQMAQDILDATADFRATYQERVASPAAFKDGDYTQKYKSVYSQYATAIFISLLIQTYNALFVLQGTDKASQFAAFVYSVANDNAFTETINTMLTDVTKFSKEHGVTASAALATMAAGAAYNEQHYFALLLVGLALTAPMPGLIDGDKVRAEINQTLKRQLNPAILGGLRGYNLYTNTSDAIQGGVKVTLNRLSSIIQSGRPIKKNPSL